MTGSRLVDEWGYFTAMPEIVIERWAELGTDAIAVFLYLRYKTNRQKGHPLEGCAWPDLETIGRETGMHYRRIGPALKTLEKAGLLTRDKRFGRSVVYTLRRPPDLAVDSPSTIGGTEKAASPSTIGGTVPPPLEDAVPPPLEGDLDRVTQDVGDPDRGKDARGASARSPHDAKRAALEAHFAEATGLEAPKATTAREKREAGALWWGPLQEILALVEDRESDALALIDESLRRLNGLTIASPASILKTARAIVAEVKRGAFRPAGEPLGFAALRHYAAEVLHEE